MGFLIAGSVRLYAFGAGVYVVSMASTDLLISCIARTMGRFGLLVIPVIIVMCMLSGGMASLGSMSDWLRLITERVSPAPHFAAFA